MKLQPSSEKMFTYLRGFLVGAEMGESLKALQFAREKHKGQARKGGAPYIIHPLEMVCYAVALGIRDDNIIATILLHDVVEDCGVMLSSLPVNDVIKTGVKYMTIQPFPGESKADSKRRYFKQLLESKEAIICKAIDRYNNLSSMIGVLSEEAIIKNIKETDELLLPVLKEAKEKWVELSNILHVLRTNIRNMNDILAVIYIRETEKTE